MSLVLSIMQPAYLPWLGYFDRILQSDLHIILDHVPMDANSKTKFTNRNKIRTSQGWSWLTVPIRSTKRDAEVPINRLEVLQDSNWRIKHWRALLSSYSKSKYFLEYSPFFKALYLKDYQYASPLLQCSTDYLLDSLGITTKCIRSSTLSPKHRKAELILELCQIVGATDYISGPFGREYLNFKSFEEAGVGLHFHDYKHPVYSQAYDGFERFMSVVDLLFNCGPTSSEILRSGSLDVTNMS